MKKSQLRDIVKEVIKELMSPYNGVSHTTQGHGASGSNRWVLETKYGVMGSKGDDGGVQYGPDYDTEKEAQKVADRKNNNVKTKKLGISFSVQEKN